MSKKREELIRTASALFAQKGYHGTSMAHIIAAAHIPKGSVYYYFPGGKEELAIVAIEQATRHIINDIKKHTDKKEMDAITAHMTYLADEMDKTDKGTYPLSISLLTMEHRYGSEALRRACRQTFLQLQKAYASYFDTATMTAEEIFSLAETISICIEGAIVLCTATGTGEPLRRQIPLLKSLYIHRKENLTHV